MSDGPDHGATFSVTSRLTSDAQLKPDETEIAERHAAPTKAARPSIGGRRQRGRGDTLAEFLGMLGYATRTAHDGPRRSPFWTSSLPTPPCWTSAASDGRVRAGRLIASGGATVGVKLVAVTGYGQPSDRVRTAAAGFDAHLVKPVDLDARRPCWRRPPERADLAAGHQTAISSSVEGNRDRRGRAPL